MSSDLQQLCEAGSQALRETQYLRAEQLLVEAEAHALKSGDFDSLSRLYFPLQEARRQKRQRCGEGTVRLDVPSAELGDPGVLRRPVPVRTVPRDRRPVHRPGRAAPRGVSRPQRLRRGLPRGRFPGRSGEAGCGRFCISCGFVIPAARKPPDRLARLLPPHTVLLPDAPFGSYSGGAHPGTPATFAVTMSLWERLHLPHLAQADGTTDLESRLHAYRRVTEIDYACELAHQNAAFTARQLARTVATRLP